MLAKLTIKNVALIERAEIEFGEGLNVLSGKRGQESRSFLIPSILF
jgi:DNA repair protein RecN (Recombination protein N)